MAPFARGAVQAMGAAGAATCLFLAGCGKADNEPGPGGVTVGEARALDEAAQMLDERRFTVEELQASNSGSAQEPSETASDAAP